MTIFGLKNLNSHIGGKKHAGKLTSQTWLLDVPEPRSLPDPVSTLSLPEPVAAVVEAEPRVVGQAAEGSVVQRTLDQVSKSVTYLAYRCKSISREQQFCN